MAAFSLKGPPGAPTPYTATLPRTPSAAYAPFTSTRPLSTASVASASPPSVSSSRISCARIPGDIFLRPRRSRKTYMPHSGRRRADARASRSRTTGHLHSNSLMSVACILQTMAPRGCMHRVTMLALPLLIRFLFSANSLFAVQSPCFHHHPCRRVRGRPPPLGPTTAQPRLARAYSCRRRQQRLEPAPHRALCPGLQRLRFCGGGLLGHANELDAGGAFGGGR
jgi:hypothetical protein